MEALDLEGIDLTWMVINEQPWPAPDHRNVLHMYRKARERALRGRYDVMWTVEHDMVLPPDAAQHLNATPGDVVYGVYIIRFGTQVLSAFRYVDNQNMGDSFSLDKAGLAEAMKHTVVRCSGTGWGCTWIRRDALKAIQFPESYPENPPFDIAFSHLLLRQGLAMYANFRVLCGHIKAGVTLWPIEHNQAVEHSDRTWLIDGQVIPQYRALAPAPVITPRPRIIGNRAHVVALQTVTARVGCESERLIEGREYDLPVPDACELARGGYVMVAYVP
jgi:hypothetical protein